MIHLVALGLGLVLSPVLFGIGLVVAGRRYVRSGSSVAGAVVAVLLLAGGYAFAALLGVVAVSNDSACLERAPDAIGDGPTYRQSWGLWPPGLRCWYTDVTEERPADHVGGTGNLAAGGTGALAGAWIIGLLRFERRRQDTRDLPAAMYRSQAKAVPD